MLRALAEYVDTFREVPKRETKHKGYGVGMFARNCLSRISKADREGDIRKAMTPLLYSFARFVASRIQVFSRCELNVGPALRLSREWT